MAVYDVFVTTGQSQFVGMAHAPSSGPPPDAKVGALEYNAGALVQIHDPTSSASPYKPQTGSAIPAYVNTFTDWSGRGIAGVRCAVGGTSLIAANAQGSGDWSPTGTLLSTSVTRTQALITALTNAGHTVGSVSILWSLGYRDASGGHNLDTYKAANSALLGRWRTALGIPDLKLYQELMYAPQVATPAIAANCLIIRQAMLDSAAETPGIEMAFTDSINYTYPAWLNDDKLHYNQVGLNNMGKKFAEYVADDLGFSPPIVSTTPVAAKTSQVGRHLVFSKPIAPLPRDYGVGTVQITIPANRHLIKIVGVGPGGRGGQGASLVKGGAGGGGAYAEVTSLSVDPGEKYEVTTTAGGSELPCTVKRLSDNVIVWRAAAGKNGTDGAITDGAGGLASDSIGDITTSGQAGGVSGQDDGGDGAPPLGGGGGTGNGPFPGTFPGGGGSGAIAGASNFGGTGAAGLVRITAA